MAEYGGLGGSSTTPERNPDDLFEATIAEAFGEQMKTDGVLCGEVWSALAGIEWHHVNGDKASYSFRAAGDLIAAIRNEGTYIDWYCATPTATVSSRVYAEMLSRGWSFVTLGFD
jgi:hypothetical protein